MNSIKHIENALKELDDEVQKILLNWDIPLNEKDNLIIYVFVKLFVKKLFKIHFKLLILDFFIVPCCFQFHHFPQLLCTFKFILLNTTLYVLKKNQHQCT